MSVVCEDHTNDQFIVRPLFQFIANQIGKPHANVHVVTNPHLTGVSELRKQACEILKRYGPISDVVVFVVDADGRDGSAPGAPGAHEVLSALVAACSEFAEKAVTVAAMQEVEVWALWGVRNELRDPWSVVRSNRDPKEAYFDPLLTAADRRTVDGGRLRLIDKSIRTGWTSFSAGCPELASLRDALIGRC